MRKIQEITNSTCTGCAACSQSCPFDAIQMKQNQQGFYLPVIDQNKCTECGRCDQICPILNREQLSQPSCYAAWAEDSIRFASSSGGAFTVLAKEVLKKNGVIFGAAWTDDFYVKHRYITSVEQLSLLQRSKYVQSQMGNCYRETKEFLKAGRTVLFTGTPCQIAALTSYLPETLRKNLILVDFICYYNPPIYYLRKYLDEKYRLENLQEFHFRDKSFGWISHATKSILKNGNSVATKNVESYFEGYFKGLYAREACINCTFSGQNHYSDITLGDFWKIEDHDPSWNDGKGTSMILARTEKGKLLLNTVKDAFQRCSQVPMDWIREGQHNCRYPHPARNYFRELITYKSFDQSVHMALNGIYDIGMVCVQSYQNYGSAFTNYALYCILKDLKYSVLIITQPLCSEIKPSDIGNFIENPFPLYTKAKQYPNQEAMKELNQKCRQFLVGSDQLFNYEIYQKIDGFVKLNWVDDQHPKSCYATSFGLDKILGTKQESVNLKQSLQRFHAVSVRESSGVELMKRNFQIEAEFVLDPVFICDKQHYLTICNKITAVKNQIFAYILDPDQEKADAIQSIASILKKQITAIPDKWMSKEYVETLWNLPTQVHQKNEVWLKYIIDSDFVVTDSFHGMCFCIIFEKQFAVIDNKRRGSARFSSLLHRLNLSNRLYASPQELSLNFNPEDRIDYSNVREILREEKEHSFNWLSKTLKNIS